MNENIPPSEKDNEFAKACDELKEKYKLKRLVVFATPEDADHELVFVSTNENPLFLLECSVNLQNFYMAKEMEDYEKSKAKALGVLALIQKIAAGNKAAN